MIAVSHIWNGPTTAKMKMWNKYNVKILTNSLFLDTYPNEHLKHHVFLALYPLEYHRFALPPHLYKNKLVLKLFQKWNYNKVMMQHTMESTGIYYYYRY